MVKKYPDLERGESAGVTGRDHIPPRVFKEAVHLNTCYATSSGSRRSCWSAQESTAVAWRGDAIEN